jgi:hypothetical protein
MSRCSISSDMDVLQHVHAYLMQLFSSVEGSCRKTSVEGERSS